MSTERVKCCRCKNQHSSSERIDVRDKRDPALRHSTCPRCGAHSFFRIEAAAERLRHGVGQQHEAPKALGEG